MDALIPFTLFLLIVSHTLLENQIESFEAMDPQIVLKDHNYY